MKTYLFATAALFSLATLTALAKGDDKVIIKNNNREIKAISDGLYLKAGGSKLPPTTELKRTDIGTLSITAPSEGFEPTDSLIVEVACANGNTPLWKESQKVAPGGEAIFDLKEPISRDYTPNGNRPTLPGRIMLEVRPMKRAQLKGIYKGNLSVR